MRAPTKVFFSLALAAGGCVTAVAVVAARFQGPEIEFGTEPAHLQPIAVPAHACPTIDQVRVAAAAAGDGWLDQRGDRVQWVAFRTQLAPKLDRLALALSAAIPMSPPPIADRFEHILHEVQIGQRALAGSTDLVQYLNATDGAVVDGVRTLGEASELVGDACGAPLYAARYVR